METSPLPTSAAPRTAELPADAAALPDPIPMTVLTGPRYRGVAAAVVRGIQAWLSVAGAMAPDAAAAWCHKRYFTPARPPLRGRDEAILAKARPCSLPWRSPAKAPYPADGELRGFRWGEGPPVVLVHGWDSRAARIAAPLVEPLCDAGFQVIAFDMPGHGSSPGKQSDLFSFVAAIRQICDDAGRPHAIVAHSMGAAASLCALVEGAPCERFIGIGPAVWLRTFPERFCKILAVRGRLRDKLYERLYQTFPEPDWERLSAHNLGPELSLPGLLFHSRDDDDTPWMGTVALARTWPRARLVLTDQLGHYRILADAEVHRQLVAFLREAPSAT